jgi:hypothetical protein
MLARAQQPRVAAAEAEAVRVQAEAAALDALSTRVRAVAGLHHGPHHGSQETPQAIDPHAGKPLEHALAESVSAALERRVNDAISIESLAVTTGGGATRATPLADMARPVPFSGGQLRAVSLRIKGAYGNYPGLRDYVAGFRALPVAVTGFSASERSFELTLTVFGG